MKIKIFVMLLCMTPLAATAAVRGSDSRVGVNRMAMAGVRGGPNSSADLNQTTQPTMTTQPAVKAPSVQAKPDESNVSGGADSDKGTVPAPGVNCRDAYRACMDEFCLLDESEGYRCACSDNINKSKSLIQEILSLQESADKLYTEGVEREKLGAKAKLVFGQSEAAKRSGRTSGVSFSEWLNADSGAQEDTDGLGADSDIGANLYEMASEYCQAQLDACGGSAEMEKVLYSRQIVADCKSFDAYLADQKRNAKANLSTAETAVRQARLEMLDTTNKYNRGECLLAYKACIADKGGCGTNFENCLDEALLTRRANACENVLDQCMAVKTGVLADWADESQTILADAALYADRNKRGTCLARIQVCLEDNCSITTNAACLTDINVAAGICPVITDCEELVPGIKDVVKNNLGALRTQFCQNDVDKCLRDKCGDNFTAPECIGKKGTEIAAMCPQGMFPSCRNETQFDIIVQAALMQMDYKLMTGCLNYFSEQLGRVCGTDMSCLPQDETVASLVELPEDGAGLKALREEVRKNSKDAVDEFFQQFEVDITVAACSDSQKPAGQDSLGESVFNSAKMIAYNGAVLRAERELDAKISELSRKQDVAKAEENCLDTYAVETPKSGEGSYSYIRSVSFEPSLRNCHVCRMQRVCETGGESKGAAGLKGLAGGLSAGAAAGTMVSPGWGTAIGGVIAGVGGYFAGREAGGEQEFCQEIESCEDINM